ncbi:Retrotransposon Gag-like protein 9 [Labeo rohita]|uniref:Retrotransposon Gag-like protein 9 n=1 Tax=Labeo rohita TaxID=84645 RepID=A0ABQ8MEG4_LABRO|nr:Retrotransposon Gag-like protein 9 [Labeo rohita]
MDPASRLFRGNQSIEDYVVDFCGLYYLVAFNDVALKDIFRHGLNEPIRSCLPGRKIHWSLEQYIDFALLLAGSPFTVGISDEGRCNPAVTPIPQPAHVMSATPEPSHAKPTKPEPVHVMSSKPKPAQVMSAKSKPALITSAKPVCTRPAHAMPAHPESVPVMAALPQPAHKTATISKPVHKMAAIPEPVHKMAAIPEPVHKMAAIPSLFTRANEVPMPPEVSASAVDPPKEVASINELTATSDHEFVPVPPGGGSSGCRTPLRGRRPIMNSLPAMSCQGGLS